MILRRANCLTAAAAPPTFPYRGPLMGPTRCQPRKAEMTVTFFHSRAATPVYLIAAQRLLSIFTAICRDLLLFCGAFDCLLPRITCSRVNAFPAIP